MQDRHPHRRRLHLCNLSLPDRRGRRQRRRHRRQQMQNRAILLIPTQLVIIMPCIEQQPLKHLFGDADGRPGEARQPGWVRVAKGHFGGEALDEGEVVALDGLSQAEGGVAWACHGEWELVLVNAYMLYRSEERNPSKVTSTRMQSTRADAEYCFGGRSPSVDVPIRPVRENKSIRGTIRKTIQTAMHTYTHLPELAADKGRHRVDETPSPIRAIALYRLRESPPTERRASFPQSFIPPLLSFVLRRIWSCNRRGGVWYADVS